MKQAGWEVDAEIAERFGVRAFPDRRGRLVVAEADLPTLLEAARADFRRDPLGFAYSIAALPIRSAPDWACDPLTVAWLRLVAVLLRVTGVGRFVRWVDRRVGGA